MLPADLYKRGRSHPLTCLTFDKYRVQEFPGFFFCNNCDMLENVVLNGSRRASRQQKRYMCTAGHTDRSHPTTMIGPYRPGNLKKEKPASAAAPVTGGEDAGRARKRSRQQSWTHSTTDDDGSSALHSSPCMKKQRREDKATPQSRRATESLFSVTPSPASLPSNETNVDVKVLMETIESLKIKNILPEKKIAELGSSRVDLEAQVNLLAVQMKDLQLPVPVSSQREEQAASAASSEKGGSDQNLEEGCLGLQEEEGKRHRRVQVENERLSQEFVNIINTFMEHSLNNRSKFPTKRIAKILIDGILSFEWTHSELTRVASKRVMSNDVVRDAFGVELARLF